RRSGRSLDDARLQVLQFLLVGIAHLLQQAQRRARLVLVHLREREADVDQDPVTGLGRLEQSDVHVALHARDVDLREAVRRVDDLDYLAWNGEAHQKTPLLAGRMLRGSIYRRPRPANSCLQPPNSALPSRSGDHYSSA